MKIHQYSHNTISPAWHCKEAIRYCNRHASYAFPSGDAFLVYPGPDEKPMSSIRAQVQREALDDLNALTTLESVVGRERVVALIMENADEPFDFEHYPHSADYIFGFVSVWPRSSYRKNKNIKFEVHVMKKKGI